MSRLLEFLERWHSSRAFSGAAYAVGTGSTVIEQGVVGTLSWDGPAVTPDSLFDLASVTKPIVALAMMALIERGVARLDDTIAMWLPDYRDTDKQDITIRQLLKHTSGIPGQQPLYQRAGDRQSLLDLVRSLPLAFPADTDVFYTSQGFMIVGLIIESASGIPLDEALHMYVLRPLGMANTRFNPPQHLMRICAATEDCPWRGHVVQGQVHDENAVVLGGVAGHAGLFSTPGDLARLAQAMLRPNMHPGFLSPMTVQQMTTHHTRGLPLARALGWQAYDEQASPAGDLFSSASYGHTGFTGTSLWMDPEQDRFVVLLTNRVHPTRNNDTIARVRPLFHNLAVRELSMSK